MYGALPRVPAFRSRRNFLRCIYCHASGSVRIPIGTPPQAWRWRRRRWLGRSCSAGCSVAPSPPCCPSRRAGRISSSQRGRLRAGVHAWPASQFWARRVVMIASAGVSVLYIVLCAVFSVLFTGTPRWIAHLRIRIATLRLWILACRRGPLWQRFSAGHRKESTARSGCVRQLLAAGDARSVRA